MKCPYCGADVFPADDRCQHCGSAVAQPAPQGVASTRADVFDRIKQSTQYAERDSPARLARVPTNGAVQLMIPVVFFAVFIGTSVFIAVMVLAMSGLMAGFGGRAGGLAVLPAMMALLPVGFVVLGVFLMTASIKKYRRISRSPIAARAAVVVGKRMSVSGGGNNSSARTHYHMTFEFENGVRMEFDVLPALYSQLAEQDAGVLFHRAEYVADFDRVGVS